MKYTFGVMSNKWSLEADDEPTALISMCIFIKKDVPIAVYSPKKKVILPLGILQKNEGNFKPDKVRDCIKTIKEVNKNGI